MIKILKSNWTATVAGTLVYIAVLALTLPQYLVSPEVAAADRPDDNMASWDYHNPDVDQLILELKNRNAALDERDADLKVLENRINEERKELSHVAQSVQEIQDKFDRNVVRLREAEAVNIKKLAKTYSIMTPEGAAAAVKGLDLDTIAKILRSMKEAEAAPILEVLAKQGGADAKHAGEIVERMRVVMTEAPGTKTP